MSDEIGVNVFADDPPPKPKRRKPKPKPKPTYDDAAAAIRAGFARAAAEEEYRHRGQDRLAKELRRDV